MFNYKLGEKYKILKLKRRKDWDGFTGKVIQQNKRFFTLQDSKGVRETFLKIDIEIGEYGVQAL